MADDAASTDGALMDAVVKATKDSDTGQTDGASDSNPLQGCPAPTHGAASNLVSDSGSLLEFDDKTNLIQNSTSTQESENAADVTVNCEQIPTCLKSDGRKSLRLKESLADDETSLKNELGCSISDTSMNLDELNIGDAMDATTNAVVLNRNYQTEAAELNSMMTKTRRKASESMVSNDADSLSATLEDSKTGADFIAMAPDVGGDIFAVGGRRQNSDDGGNGAEGEEKEGGAVPLEEMEEADDVSDDLDDFPNMLSTSERSWRSRGAEKREFGWEGGEGEGEGDGEEGEENGRRESEERERESIPKVSPPPPTPPPDTWHPFAEIRRRELGGDGVGGRGRRGDAALFARRVGASVELARRLVLHTQLDKHTGCVNALHFNETGTLLASGADDLKIVVWKWIESKAAYAFNSGHSSNVFQCKFMPLMGDTHMVSCARDGQVRLAELTPSGVRGTTKRLAEHRGAAHKVSLKCDSAHSLYTCGEDAVVFDIDLREDKPRKLCAVKENGRRVELYSIHSHPFRSNEFCVGGRDQYVRLYDARKISEGAGGILKKFCPQHMIGTDSSSARNKANVTAAVYNHDGTEVLASYNDEDIYLFETHDTNCSVFCFTGHRNNATVKGVNFYGPRSEFVISGSDCGNVFVWEKNSQRVVNYFHADDGGVVNVLEPNPHVPVLATSGLDSDIKIWFPLAPEPSSLVGLDRVMRKNSRERDLERSEEPDVDSQMLWLLMQHLRRSARRQARRQAEQDQEQDERGRGAGEEEQGGRGADEPSTSDDDDDDGDDDSDNEEGAGEERGGFDPGSQCRPS